MNYKFEEKKFKKYLDKHLLSYLEEHNMIVAGGAITSIFTNKEINDIDVYARTKEDAINFIADIWQGGNYVVSHTNKATQIKFGDKLVQLIHFNTYENVEDIFKSFDFTACMGAYDFKLGKFILHDDFLKHNSQRILRYNKNTNYPIISAVRIQKYEEKGYKISKPEYIRIILSCMNLNISSYDELKEHLGGMYGINYDRLFEDVKNEEFNLDTAIDKIANITLSDEYFEEFIYKDDFTLEKIIDDIEQYNFKYTYINDNLRKVRTNGKIFSTKDVVDETKVIDLKDAIKFDKIYKFVKKDGDKYFSFWDSKFEYKIGEEAVANNNRGYYGSSNSGKLYFNINDEIDESSYFNNENGVLIEASFDIQDLVDFESNDAVTVKKAKIIREVSKEEWFEWVGYVDATTEKEELPF